MNTTHTQKKFLTATIGAAIAGSVAPALLFLVTGTAHAIQDVSETLVPPLVQDVSERLEVPLIQDVSDRAPNLTIGAFNPQPDPPGIIDPGSTVGIGGPDTRPSIIDPGSRVGIIDPGLTTGILDPGSKVGLGGPDTRPAP